MPAPAPRSLTAPRAPQDEAGPGVGVVAPPNRDDAGPTPAVSGAEYDVLRALYESARQDACDLATQLRRAEIDRDVAAGARDAERQIARELRREGEALRFALWALAQRIGLPLDVAELELREHLADAEAKGRGADARAYRLAVDALAAMWPGAVAAEAQQLADVQARAERLAALRAAQDTDQAALELVEAAA